MLGYQQFSQVSSEGVVDPSCFRSLPCRAEGSRALKYRLEDTLILNTVVLNTVSNALIHNTVIPNIVFLNTGANLFFISNRCNIHYWSYSLL